MSELQTNKPHRKLKEKKSNGSKSTRESNPKAFAFAKPGKLQRQAARSHDVKEKRLHVPLVDRIPEDPPPLIVAVVGPPGVGKTTLIKSLIRRYTKQSLSKPTGPLTVVASKKRRLTFIECPSDSLASMIDIAKIVDIVLLMIDGLYGFEMETMEFLNVLNSSGMPGNVFGILTHLDLFKKQETLKAQKRRLKHRFWSELYQGAKLFYLSGVMNGRYPDREILNLSRFLSVMKKPRPLVFRQSHPYCLADRFLDITPPTIIEENSKCDRTIALYGYLRGGTNFTADGARAHIPGLGDFTISRIEKLPDPCPTPNVQQAIEKATGKTRTRKLGEKQKVMYAPMSDVGGVLVDKDAVYIDVKTNIFSRDTENEEQVELGLGEQLMFNLQNDRKLLGHSNTSIQLFSNGNALSQKPTEEIEDSGRKTPRKIRRTSEVDENYDVENEAYDSAENDEDGEVDENEEPIDIGEDMESDDEFDPEELKLNGTNSHVDDLTTERNLEFADSDSDLGSVSSVDDQEFDEEEEGDGDDDEYSEGYLDGELNWKSNLSETARKLHGKRIPYRTRELASLLYDESFTPEQVILRWTGQENQNLSQEAEDDEFFKKAKTSTEFDMNDRMIQRYDYKILEEKWNDENILELRSKFTSMGVDASANGEDGFDGFDEDEGDGEFEDLETGEKFDGTNSDNITNGTNDAISEVPNTLEDERARNAKRKEELKLRFEVEDRSGFLNDKNKDKDGDEDPEFGEDDWYDTQKALLEKQQSINRAEFDQLDEISRVRVEGYRAGTYARLIVENVAHEFCENFNAKYPVIIGGITSTEERLGFVQVRIKRHRWHKKILKTNDPLIFSLGWRRFQTTPIYSISDSRIRNRMLKYTPEHMHCFGNFYGPLIAPATPFCCVQSLSNSNPNFRIAASGTVLSVDESVEIVKKLKLIGHPYKIFRNTAFIKDMFNTSLEIAKFEGASIKTVSGIRGQIKRALSKPEGNFRAAFEDKILMSDIVFLRAWYPIKPHRYYNPVTNLLGENSWVGMRLTGELRRIENVPTPLKANSAYRPIEREDRHFNPLRVPRKLAADLPFKTAPTVTLPQRKATYLQQRAVIAGAEERRARNLMDQLLTLKKAKDAKRMVAKEKHRDKYRQKVAENEEKRREREKRETEDYWRKEGRKRHSKSDGDGGSRKKARR